MMENTVILAVPLWAVICLGSLSANEMSHNMWLTRVEKPEVNNKYIKLKSMEVKKLDSSSDNYNKNARCMNLNFTSFIDLDSDEILCELKLMQKQGGKYLKAPMDFPRGSCCKFFKSSPKLWGCLQRHSSFPEDCPIPKGEHWVKDFNPDECNPAEQLPNNLPEDYKGIVTMWKGHDQICKVVGYGMLKRKMSVG